MMEIMYMADQNVQRELQAVNDRLTHHDSILDQMKTVLVNQAKLMEQQVSSSIRFADYQNRTDKHFAEYQDRTDKHLEKIDSKVEANKMFIMKVVGGVSALCTLAGTGILILKLLELGT